jgi:nicotinate-nucleotide adenylyltransferase
VRRATVGNPRFAVDAREVERDAPSYTVDTLTGLRAELGSERPLWLLLGADAFLGLPTWHDWRRLFVLANIAVATRPGSVLADGAAMPAELKDELARRTRRADSAGGVLLRDTPALDISATAIRDTLARRCSARYLLPDVVLDYIHEQKLYA